MATAESVANTAATLTEPTVPSHMLTAVAAASPFRDDADADEHADDEHATATMRPQRSARAVPTVAVLQATMIAAAMTHLRWRDAIISGQPAVPLAIPSSAASIAALRLDVDHPDPTGRHPLHFVIVQGDLETAMLFPDGGGTRRPARYVALLLDRLRRAPGGVTSVLASSDGAVFRQALNDPSLPLPD